MPTTAHDPVIDDNAYDYLARNLKRLGVGGIAIGELGVTLADARAIVVDIISHIRRRKAGLVVFRPLPEGANQEASHD